MTRDLFWGLVRLKGTESARVKRTSELRPGESSGECFNLAKAVLFKLQHSNFSCLSWVGFFHGDLKIKIAFIIIRCIPD